MTKEELTELQTIATSDLWAVPRLLKEYIKTAKVTEGGKRSPKQNNALHLDCSLIAEKLNDAGLDMRTVLKPTYQLPWTTESVKDHIWKPFMKSMYGKESTRELDKTSGEIDKIHDTIMRELGEKHGIEYHPFPQEEKTNVRLSQEANLSNDNYPEYREKEHKPTF